MTGQLLTATLALFFFTILPGPDIALVTRAALTSGRGGATKVVAGISTGLLVWGAATVAGLAALLAASATAYSVVKYVCVGYLVVLGIQIIVTSSARAGRPISASGPMQRPFRIGLMNNLLNPKIAVFYTGVLPELAPDGMSHTAALLLLVAIHVLITILWQLAYAAIVHRAGDWLQQPHIRRRMDRLTGAAFIGFGLKVAVEKR